MIWVALAGWECVLVLAVALACEIVTHRSIQQSLSERLADERSYAKDWRADAYQLAKAYDALLAEYQRQLDREVI